MTELTFRPITLEDMPLLNRLTREGKGYWGYPPEALDRFMATFAIQDAAYFQEAIGCIGKNADGMTVGFYAFKLEDTIPMLDHFFLAPSFIGQGYGRLLWDRCLITAQQQNWDSFNFWADPNALDFYEHMGAEKIDECPMVTLPGNMAPIMRYSLTPLKKAL